MALTAEQLNTVEFQKELEAERRAHEVAMEKRRAKLEAVRLAKETLVENDRSKPADERGVSADDIKTMANTLITYINE